MSKEKPILFNAEMVRAILDGRKTQTRRICKFELEDTWENYGPYDEDPMEEIKQYCPFGSIGDELYVRETMYSDGDGWWFPERGEFDFPYDTMGETIEKWCKHQIEKQRVIVPSIHMPRWASRIQLKITDIRVERVADISDNDALSEGIKPSEVAARGYCDARVAFRVLWNSINTAPGKTWTDNPWVWVVEFERIK